MAWIDSTLNLLLNKYRLVRVVVLGTATWMTVESLHWAYGFANLWIASNKTGLDTAAVVAAVTAPATGYAAWAFQVYVGSRKEDA